MSEVSKQLLILIPREIKMFGKTKSNDITKLLSIVYNIQNGYV